MPRALLLTGDAAEELDTMYPYYRVQEGGWVVISVFTAVISLIATVSALTARESKSIPTAELGRQSEKREELAPAV